MTNESQTRLALERMKRKTVGFAIGAGERIRKARIARGLTQEQLAQNDFSKSYLSAVELGKIQPSIRSLRILSSRLQVPLSQLIGSTEGEAENQNTTLILARARLAVQIANPTALQTALQQLESLTANVLPTDQEAETYYLESCCLAGLQHYEQALLKLQASERLWQALNLTEWVVRTIVLTGEIYFRQNRLEEAVSCFEAALAAMREGQVWDFNLKLKIISTLARLYRLRDNNQKVQKFLVEAEAIINSLPSVFNDTETLEGLADQYESQHDYIQARAMLERATGVVSSINFSRQFLQIYAFYGAVSAELGDNANAISSYTTAIATTQWNLSDPEVARSYNELARLYLKQARVLDAKVVLKQAQTSLEKLNQPSPEYNLVAGLVLMTLAQVAELESEPNAADAYFVEAERLLLLTGQNKVLASVYYDYGDLLVKRGKTNAGKDYLRKAYELR